MSDIVPILTLSEVGIRCRQKDESIRTFFEGLSFTLGAREHLLVVGPSGSGKSTLINYIAGFIRRRPARSNWFDRFRFGGGSEYEVVGGIAIEGIDVSEWDTRRRRVGLVMHGPTLHPHKTALENILFPLTVQNLSPDVQRSLAQEAAERASFPAGRLHAAPDRLSAGEAQRAVIARMLARRPRVALMDEPFAHLDPTLRRRLGREVRQALFNSEAPACMISVTHDWDDLQDDEIGPKKVLVLNPVDGDRAEHIVCSVGDARAALRATAVIDFSRAEGVA